MPREQPQIKTAIRGCARIGLCRGRGGKSPLSVAASHVEFEKGKAAVAVATKEKLPAVVETLTAAARAGELDEILTHASKQRPFQKSRKAA